MDLSQAISFSIWLFNNTWWAILLLLGVTLGGAIIGLIINQADQIDLDLS